MNQMSLVICHLQIWASSIEFGVWYELEVLEVWVKQTKYSYAHMWASKLENIIKLAYVQICLELVSSPT